MNIAVIMDEKITSGGGFQYALSTILLLNKNKSKEYNYIFFTTIKENMPILKKYKIDVFYLHNSRYMKIIYYLRRNLLVYQVIEKLKIFKTTKLNRTFKKHDIDLVYFTSPSSLALFIEQFNYIFTLWDLCHRDHVEFPEIKSYQEFEKRELLYKTVLPKAVKVITESELNRINIIKRYNIDEERVVVLPMLPSKSVYISQEEYERNYINIKKMYHINGDYIFYPAQFWTHKNHIYILEGLKIIKDKYKLRINVVFSGTDKGNLKFILNKAKEFRLDEQLFYIGFVDDKYMPYLYKQALALVMPTYFGPTNIPPLEAFKLECPVLYSNLLGLKEQVKDAALLIDLKDPESFATQLLMLIDGSVNIKTLVTNGKKKVDAWTENSYWIILKNIFDDYAIKLKCWK